MNSATIKKELALIDHYFHKGFVYVSETSENMICIVTEPRRNRSGYSWCYVCRVIGNSYNEWRVPFPNMATETEIFFNELDDIEHLVFNNELYFGSSIFFFHQHI